MNVSTRLTHQYVTRCIVFDLKPTSGDDKTGVATGQKLRAGASKLSQLICRGLFAQSRPAWSRISSSASHKDVSSRKLSSRQSVAAPTEPQSPEAAARDYGLQQSMQTRLPPRLNRGIPDVASCTVPWPGVSGPPPEQDGSHKMLVLALSAQRPERLSSRTAGWDTAILNRPERQAESSTPLRPGMPPVSPSGTAA